MRIVTPIALVLATAACGEMAPDNRFGQPNALQTNEVGDAPGGTAYRCDDGSTVRVRFDRETGGAEVTMGEAAPAMLNDELIDGELVYRDAQTEMRMAGADVVIGPRGRPGQTCRVGAESAG